MTDRNQIALRKERLVQTGKLLAQVKDGATTFSEKTEDDKRQIMHNGKPTGFFVSEALYEAVVNEHLPKPPRMRPDKIEVYDLSPSELETEFKPMFEYVEAVCIYMMTFYDVGPQGVVVEAERTGPESAKWTIRKVQDDSGISTETTDTE